MLIKKAMMLSFEGPLSECQNPYLFNFLKLKNKNESWIRVISSPKNSVVWNNKF